MKNLAKSTVIFLTVIGALGAVVAIASVLNCGTVCDFAVSQAKQATAALVTAHQEQAAAQVTATQPQ